MARYIDADRLLVFLEKNFGNTGGANTLKQLIDIQPTADVAEIKHGKNVTEMNPVDEFVCSECGIIIQNVSRYDPEEDVYMEYECKYCPECGAKIDEED